MGWTHVNAYGPVSPTFLGGKSCSGDASGADRWLHFQDPGVLASFHIFLGHHLEVSGGTVAHNGLPGTWQLPLHAHGVLDLDLLLMLGFEGGGGEQGLSIHCHCPGLKWPLQMWGKLTSGAPGSPKDGLRRLQMCGRLTSGAPGSPKAGLRRLPGVPFHPLVILTCQPCSSPGVCAPACSPHSLD